MSVCILTTYLPTDREKLAHWRCPSEPQFSTCSIFRCQPLLFSGYLRFHICYHRRQQPFAFLLSSGIDLSCFQPSIWPCDRIASNPLTVLIFTERPGSPPALSLPDRPKIGHRGHGFCYRCGLRHFRLADTPVDPGGGLSLHIACDMGVDIQRSGTGDVPDDGRQGLDIHPMFQSIGSENVPQVVEAYLFASGVF